ncbi:hypothetical protein AeRB84_020464 [Aphanomyces euteiches]|nr:hypothetical protein AeRB84_020464 [Aphanomyces euteiches]
MTVLSVPVVHQHTDAVKRRPRPTIAQKLWAVSVLENLPIHDAVRITGACSWALSGRKPAKKNIGITGAKAIVPDAYGLALYIRDIRRQEMALTAAHMISYLRVNHNEWLSEYMSTRKSVYSSLLRLLQRFAHRNGFSRQRLCRQKRPQEDLEETQLSFGRQFHEEYGDFPSDCVYNTDKTEIYYDMSPKTIWAVKGEGAFVANAEKHSLRMAALLTIRADGQKLSIVFVIRGVPGGCIESNEFESYPPVHHYVMQSKAWMDGPVWRTFLRDVLMVNIENPSVLIVDNFESHVSEESERIVSDELGCHLYLLPPNSTSYYQPLEKSIMGPFKQHLRDLWVLANDDAKTAKEKRISIIKRAIEAWDKISPEEVRKSFFKALPKPE